MFVCNATLFLTTSHIPGPNFSADHWLSVVTQLSEALRLTNPDFSSPSPQKTPEVRVVTEEVAEDNVTEIVLDVDDDDDESSFDFMNSGETNEVTG